MWIGKQYTNNAELAALRAMYGKARIEDEIRFLTFDKIYSYCHPVDCIGSEFRQISMLITFIDDKLLKEPNFAIPFNHFGIHDDVTKNLTRIEGERLLIESTQPHISREVKLILDK